jgi:hypothetical protein
MDAASFNFFINILNNEKGVITRAGRFSHNKRKILLKTLEQLAMHSGRANFIFNAFWVAWFLTAQ